MPAEDRPVGRIIEIKGVVLDAVFDGELPEIYNALEITRRDAARSWPRSSSTSATTGSARSP